MPVPNVEHESLLTPAEVSTMFRVDPKTVTRWAKAGKLTSIRTLGGHRRYRESEVKALLAGIPLQRDPLAELVGSLWSVNPRPPGLTVRNRLQAAGIVLVRDLTALRADDLEDLVRLSPDQVNEVRLVLHRKGLALYGEIADKVA